LGSEIGIGSGVQADDRVIVAPPDGIADGDRVRVANARFKSDATLAGSAKPTNGD
jgi:hypothetical protein